MVGGALRDFLMGLDPVDWDIATNLAPDKLVALFPGCSQVGIEFGSVNVKGIDVVSLRREEDYRDGRHPSSVSFGASIAEDLKRRDFTVNAMAAEFPALEIIDPFGGREDLSSQLLRVVGDPETKLGEDPLRIMRAIRFKTVLGFNLEPSLSRAILSLAPRIKAVSGVRIFAELSKIIVSPSVYQGIKDLDAYRIGEFILPEIFGRGAVDRVALALSLSDLDLPLRLALLFRAGIADGGADGEAGEGELASTVQSALSRWGVPGGLAKKVQWLIKSSSPSGFLAGRIAQGERDQAYIVRRLLDEAGSDDVERLADLFVSLWRASGRVGFPLESRAIEAGLWELAPNAGQIVLALSGKDVIETLGVTSGPEVGEALRYLKEAVFRDPKKNEKGVLLGLLRRWKRR